jgi:hypothetical protein
MLAWPRFLPDLTLWHPWHSERGTLPERWNGFEMPEVCDDLGVRTWAPVRSWRIELPGVEVSDDRQAGERVLRWGTPRGTLTSRWRRGPDGDWWQSEYPVKSGDDLAAALLVAEARRYVRQPDQHGTSSRQNCIVATELPQRPWSELFHTFLGWSEGLMIFLEEPGRLRKIVSLLEEKLAVLEHDLAAGPADAVLCPDNLDGQFISPLDFEAHLASSYRRAAGVMHEHGKPLVVHVGGPIRRLLPGLSSAGVDCIEGVCESPQGDVALSEARAVCGGRLVLWGGVAQDYLLATRSEREFLDAAREALRQAASDPLAVLGVADKVPVDAVPERLVALAEMASG